MNPTSKVLPAIALAAILMAGQAVVSAEQRDDVLASVQLGSRVDELFDAFPGLYAHRLKLGEVLYEVCDQKNLNVFSFTEEPWSRGRITYIWVRKAEDRSTCRDETGALPNTSKPATTPRGIAVGDPDSKVTDVYGKPGRVNRGRAGHTVLVYSLAPSEARVEHLSLAFTIAGEEVIGFSLSGDVPGAQKPR